MIKVDANTLSTQRLFKNLRTLPRETKKVEARELNRQMRASISGTGNSKILPVIGMVRRMARGWGVSPQRRIRRRIFVPRGAFAKPTRLAALGLTLFEELPMRYFQKQGLPSGAEARQTVKPDTIGRVPFGPAFTVRLQSGATGKMRKLTPQKWGRKGRRNFESKSYLPIGWAEFADVSTPAYSIRQAVLVDLARWFPRQMDMAFQKLMRRRFGIF